MFSTLLRGVGLHLPRASRARITVVPRPVVRVKKAVGKKKSDEEDKVDLPDYFGVSETRLLKKLEREGKRTLNKDSSDRMVFVIHPIVKGPTSRELTRIGDFQREEAVGLVEAIVGWKAVDSRIIKLRMVGEESFFTGTALNTVVEWLNEVTFSAVMLNYPSLSPKQQASLELAFGCPVLDRYTVVLNIFKERARTREAKVQVRT